MERNKLYTLTSLSADLKISPPSLVRAIRESGLEVKLENKRFTPDSALEVERLVTSLREEGKLRNPPTNGSRSRG